MYDITCLEICFINYWNTYRVIHRNILVGGNMIEFCLGAIIGIFIGCCLRVGSDDE